MQIKRCLKVFEVDMAKNGCGQMVTGLKIDCMLKMNRWKNWFFWCWYRFSKNKSRSKISWMGMVEDGCGKCGHGTLKLTVCQKWADGINWFYACWYKFRKVKSWFNDFWVGVVKNGDGVLVYGTLKYAVSLEWIYELSWFFECWYWCNNFWFDWYPFLWLLNAGGPLQLYLFFVLG